LVNYFLNKGKCKFHLGTGHEGPDCGGSIALLFLQPWRKTGWVVNTTVWPLLCLNQF